jgi:2-keto-4-pentenoate hydratase/2-oxohepta-3-ene-1,7-dioic acid hydratase in catechol pathway
MKLGTFSGTDGASRLGVAMPGSRILDVGAAHAAASGASAPQLASMMALIESGASGRKLIEALLRDESAIRPFVADLSRVRLRAPLPLPMQIRDCSLFEQHVRNGGAGMQKLKARLAGRPEPADIPRTVPDVYREQPIYYMSNRFSVVGPEEVVTWPSYSRVMDFELELGLVIGKTGRDIALEKAAEHIFGYTIFNDFSARDQQGREMEGWLGPTKGKTFDTGNSIGPWIVTPEELGDPRKLTVAVRVNGTEWASNTTEGMLHSYEQMIAFISRDETLHAGELIGSGTVGGCCGLEMGRFLDSGDVVELEVSGIGVLRNRVLAHGQVS